MTDDDEPQVMGLVDAVTRDLTNAGAVDTFHGQLALQLARKVAHHEATGVSTLSKELRAVLALALAQPSVSADAGDEIDEVARKRDDKRTAAGEATS